MGERIQRFDIFVGDAGEGAFFRPSRPTGDPEQGKETDAIAIILGGDGTKILPDGDPAMRLFANPAAIKEAFIHESAHAHFEEVARRARGGDQTAQQLLDKFSELFKADLQIVGEMTRERHGAIALPWLQSVKQQLAAEASSDDVRAVQGVIDAFGTPHGLDNLTVACSKTNATGCSLRAFGHMTKAFAERQGFSLSDKAREILAKRMDKTTYLPLLNAYGAMLENPALFPRI